MIQHISTLFQDTKTIIIPGLGALTITNPVTQELMFMPYLKHNDGVLVEFMAGKEGITAEEAKAKIEAEVAEIKTQLDAGKTVPFGTFGSFATEDGDYTFVNSQDENPEPAAEPVVEPVAAAPIVEPTPEEKPEEVVPPTPEPEALEEVAPEPAAEEVVETPAEKEETVLEESVAPEYVPEPEAPSEPEPKIAAEEVKKEPEVVPVSEPKIEETPKKNLNILEKEEIEANRKKLNDLKESKKAPRPKRKRGAGFYILIALLVILAGGGTYVGLNYDQVKEYVPFLADSKTPVNKSSKEKEKMRELVGEEKPVTDETAEEETIPDETLTEEAPEEVATPTKPEKEEPKPQSKPKPAASGSNSLPFHIVAGVFSSAENAQRLTTKIQAMGYPAKMIVRGSQNIVSVQSYASKAEAEAAISSVQDAAPKGWVLEWRN